MTSTHYAVAEEALGSFWHDGVVRLPAVLDRCLIAELAGAIDGLLLDLEMGGTELDRSRDLDSVFVDFNNGLDQGRVGQDPLAISLAAPRQAGTAPSLDALTPASCDKRHVRLDAGNWMRSLAIRRLALDSVLPGIAAQLLNAECIKFLDDQVFVKEPSSAEHTAVHRDDSFLHPQGWTSCVMWVCVDEADERSGVPVYARGSHQWDEAFDGDADRAQLGILGGQHRDRMTCEPNLDRVELVEFQVAPGDVLVHHFRTMHGVGSNLTGRPRRALSLRYCGEDARFAVGIGAQAPAYQAHGSKEAGRLDRAPYPLVWPRPHAAFALTRLLSRQIN